MPRSHACVVFRSLRVLLFLLATSCVLPSALWAQSYLEGPAPGSSQGGIGLIRGWACHANLIEIQIDNDPRMQAAYGTTRPDTQGVCGDQENGFGLTWNWNRSGNGTHRVRAFNDGVLFGDVTVHVTTLGSEFLRGKSGGYYLPDFPNPGDQVTIEWDEGQQNFVIQDFTPKPTGGGGGCCKICTTGKPCGDTCISQSFTCHVGPGCAC